MFYLWYSFLWPCLFIIKSVTAQCCLNHVLFGGKNEFIDLTFPLDNRTVYFKSEAPNFTLIENNDNKKWPKFDEIRTPNYGGTHIVTPYFVKEDGFSVGDIPAEKLIVQLIVIDVSSRVNDDSKYVLYMKDVESALDKDSLEHMSKYNSLVVFKFGWSKHYYHSKYLGYDEKTDSYHFPSVSTEVAQWLISDKSFKVVGIGVDLFSPDISTSEDSFRVHKILAKAGIYIVKGLNLDPLNVTGHNCTVGVLPMKIAGTAAAPVSVVAACPTVASCDDGDHESGEESEDHEKKDQGHLSGCHGHGCHHGHSCHHGHGSHHHSSHGEHESSNHESHESNELHTQKPEQSGQGTTAKPNNQGNKQQVTSTGSPNIMGTISKIKDKLPFPGKF